VFILIKMMICDMSRVPDRVFQFVPLYRGPMGPIVREKDIYAPRSLMKALASDRISVLASDCISVLSASI
jgi:hypothetical protein